MDDFQKSITMNTPSSQPVYLLNTDSAKVCKGTMLPYCWIGNVSNVVSSGEFRGNTHLYTYHPCTPSQ
jgi:hypothetical protein